MAGSNLPVQEREIFYFGLYPLLGQFNNKNAA
jgi:hypothetical protein